VVIPLTGSQDGAEPRSLRDDEDDLAGLMRLADGEGRRDHAAAATG
jgi:hypothetical protein